MTPITLPHISIHRDSSGLATSRTSRNSTRGTCTVRSLPRYAVLPYSYVTELTHYQVIRYILVGPKAAIDGPGGGEGGTKPGRARIYNITKINEPIIAYGACVVWLAIFYCRLCLSHISLDAFYVERPEKIQREEEVQLCRVQPSPPPLHEEGHDTR